MKRKLALFVCSIMLIGSLTACGSGSSVTKGDEVKQQVSTKGEVQNEGKKAEDQKKQLKMVGVSEYDSSFQFFVNLGAGTKAEAEKHQISLNVQDAKADAQRQVQQIENFIAQKVDAIIVHTVDSAAVAPAIKKAMDSGIPTISVYQKVDEALSSFLIDEKKYGYFIGKMAGEWAAKKYANMEIEAAILYAFEYKTSITRMESCKETFLKLFPTGKIVATQNANSPVEAMAAVETIMQAHPKVKIIMCDSDDTSGLGTSEALASLVSKEKWNDYYVGAADGTGQAIKKIKEGSLYKGTVDLMPIKVGKQLIDVLIKNANGEKVDKIIYSEFKEVTPEIAKNEY